MSGILTYIGSIFVRLGLTSTADLTYGEATIIFLGLVAIVFVVWKYLARWKYNTSNVNSDSEW